MPRIRRWVGLAVLVCAAACDNLSCYDDTDRPEPFPPEPPTALPLDTPTKTEDGEFRIVLRAPSEDEWPPPASSVTLVLEVDGMPHPLEMTAAPAYWADDPAMHGDEPRVSMDGPASFRIASAVPDPGLWCLPVDVAAGDRVDGLDVCFEAR